MLTKKGLIDLANRCQAISLFSGKSKYDSTQGRTAGTLTFKIPLLMILNTPSRIKVAIGGSAAISCTCPGNNSYK